MAKFYAHLHNHFDFSQMDSTNKISNTLAYAKELGYEAFSINDHGTILGWDEFDRECESQNIKPIYGVECYEAPKSAKHKEGVRYYHANFMAKNEQGKLFLHKLVTYAYKQINFYYKPRYDIQFLLDHKDEIKGNVIFSSACIGGRLPKLLLEGKKKEALEYYKTLVDIFGEDDVYIEIQNHGEAEETRGRNLLIEFSKEVNGQLLATNDIHYLKKENYLAREILIARNSNTVKTLRERRELGKIYPSELYVKTKEQMDDLFSDVPEALENTKKLVDSVEWISLKGNKWHYPKTNIPEGFTPKEYLKKMTLDRVPNKYPINTYSEDERKDFYNRIDMEIDVMDKMDAIDYMLIDEDFTTFAKSKMRVGKGRGSVCGSLVANIIDISDIDPIRFDLFFERKYCAR